MDQNSRLGEVLDQIEEYLEQREDADGVPSGGGYRPNEEMNLLTELRAARGGGDEALKLLRRALDLRELGAEGPFKTDVRAFLARCGAANAPTRFERQRAIEQAIAALSPNTSEAVELLQSFMAALRNRYGEDVTLDAMERLNEAREAIDEIDLKLPDDGKVDECDLSRADAIRRAEELAGQA